MHDRVRLVDMVPRLGFLWFADRPTDVWDNLSAFPITRHEKRDTQVHHALCEVVGDIGMGRRNDGRPKINKAAALVVLEAAFNNLVGGVHDPETDVRCQLDIVDWVKLVRMKGLCPLALAVPENVW